MQRIIKMDPANRLIIVEPGVLNQTVQDIAAEQGFFWPPDPSSAAFCTVGGNLAYNAAGPRAVKYGATRENTLALIAVTGAGNIIHVGTATTKGAVGYDLTRLLIGSEGTLAIITEATLKLTPLPEAKQVIRAVYRTITAATTAVTQIMAQAVMPCALEFMDAKAIALIRAQGVMLPVEAGALLLIEIDGLAGELTTAAKKIEQAAQHPDLLEIKIAANALEAKQLWAARKALSPALRTLAPNKINEDVVVPVANIPLLLQQLAALSDQYQINIVNFGHAGNGNIHVNLLIDANDVAQRRQAEQCLVEVFKCVLALQGTLSGEHGIGIEKRAFISQAIDHNTLNLMRQIKTVFDPNGILNPGKIFPAEESLN
jgi:D-lactate dehydrogenase